jgi:hypothetical protein
MVISTNFIENCVFVIFRGENSQSDFTEGETTTATLTLFPNGGRSVNVVRTRTYSKK